MAGNNNEIVHFVHNVIQTSLDGIKSVLYPPQAISSAEQISPRSDLFRRKTDLVAKSTDFVSKSVLFALLGFDSLDYKAKEHSLTGMLFCLVPMAGDNRCAFVLLDDPNATHFGTRLRNKKLKTIINRFLNAFCPLRVRLP